MKVKLGNLKGKKCGWTLCDDIEQVYDLLNSGLVHKLHIEYNIAIVIQLLDWIRNSNEIQPEISIQIKGS